MLEDKTFYYTLESHLHRNNSRPQVIYLMELIAFVVISGLLPIIKVNNIEHSLIFCSIF